MSNETGCLYVVATPIGNLDDITLRAIRTLGEVDRILAEDTRHTRRLLTHLGIDKPMQSLHEHNERADVAALVSQMKAGRKLALVSDAGTPLISDPGFPLVRACRADGVDVIAVPGPSAVIAALSVSGLPTDRFRFEGFLPRKASARQDYLARLAADDLTVVFYESCHRIVDTLRDCVAAFGGGRLAVVARELTKRYETVRLDTLAELANWIACDMDQQRGEFVVLLAGSSEPALGDHDELLRALLAELPLKQAVSIVARFSGQSRNAIYRRALELQ